MEPKICIVCGSNFHKKKSESQKYWETKKYCSSQCSLTKTSIAKSSMQSHYQKGHKSWNKCLTYSEEQKSRLNLDGLVLGRVKGRPRKIGKENPRWTSIEKTCIICSKIFFVQPYRAEKARFCGHDCYHKWHIGKNSPVWTDNYKKRFRIRIMELKEYKDWRLDVFRRNRFTCQHCGIVRKEIEADHIVPFKQLIEQNNITDVEQARTCKELWNIENGRTLCKSCHRKTDTYGNRK